MASIYLNIRVWFITKAVISKSHLKKIAIIWKPNGKMDNAHYSSQSFAQKLSIDGVQEKNLHARIQTRFSFQILQDPSKITLVNLLKISIFVSVACKRAVKQQL